MAPKRIRRWILVADAAGGRIVERLGTGMNTRILEPHRFGSNTHLPYKPPCERPVIVRDRLGFERRAISPACNRICKRETRFACQVAELLREEMVRGDFDRLLIVAPPSMLRDLRAAMIAAVQAKVVAEVATNLTKATNTEVVHHLESKKLLS